MGVTPGAVYKWESGQSQPELNLVVEMADFFDTSVDVLLGYQMKDNRPDCALERIQSYCQTLDPAALPEAEKTLAKYPHSFRARNDWVSAKAILTWGIDLLAGLKTETVSDILEMTHAEMLVLLAYVQKKSGTQEQAREALRKARTMALHFDATPDYSLKAVPYLEHTEPSVFFNIFGGFCFGKHSSSDPPSG